MRSIVAGCVALLATGFALLNWGSPHRGDGDEGQALFLQLPEQISPTVYRLSDDGQRLHVICSTRQRMDSQVAVINVTAKKVLEFIDLPGGSGYGAIPWVDRGIALGPLSEEGNLALMELTSGKVIADLGHPSRYGYVIDWSKDGQRVFIAGYDQAKGPSVFSYDLERKVCGGEATIPHPVSLVYGERTGRLYVGTGRHPRYPREWEGSQTDVEGTTLLVVLDAQTLAQVAEVQVPTKRPASGIDSLALSPDEKTLYCGYAWDDGKGVYAVDTEKNELRPDWVAEVEAERLEVFQVWPLVMHPSGRYLLGVEWGPSDKMVPRRVVAKPPPLPQDQELSWSRQAHCVTLIDVLEKRIVTRLQIGRRPSGIVLSTDGNTLYTCDRVTGRVYFVNLSELLTRPVPGASEPDGNAGDK